MRVLIISDIHANLAAFQAVLADADGDWDTIWFLGDLVGYGPDPNECTALLREHDHLSLSGNHDWAVLDRLDLASFNDDARNAISWTREILTEDNRDYLAGLSSKVVRDGFTLVHASPRHPVWEYILEPSTAAANFDYFDSPYCLVGHTHVPVIYVQDNSHKALPFAPDYSGKLDLNHSARLIINPGSVGQPRDYDSRAAYAILDMEQMVWMHRRVAYSIDVTKTKMERLQLPKRLISRLDYGW